MKKQVAVKKVDAKKEVIYLDIDPKTYSKIKKAAKERKMSVNDWIDEAVLDMIKNIKAGITLKEWKYSFDKRNKGEK